MTEWRKSAIEIKGTYFIRWMVAETAVAWLLSEYISKYTQMVYWTNKH